MEIITLDIKQIRPAPYNPRKDLQPSDPEYRKLKKSIDEFDLVEPLIWNKRSGNLVGGHQRLKILKELGRSSVDVSVVDLDEAKEKALNIALNKISGEWDLPGLKDLLQELDTGDFDMEITGFDDKEIEDLINQLYTPGDGLTDDDAIPEATESVCRRGDLWKLGNHRLLCGDATIKKDVDKLMGGEKADMVFTDPPYELDTEGGGILKDAKSMKGIKRNKLDHFDPLILEKAAPTSIYFCNKPLIPLYIEKAVAWKVAWDIAIYKKENTAPNHGGHLTTDLEYLMILGKQNPQRGLENELYSKLFIGKKDDPELDAWVKPVALCEKFINLFTLLSQLVYDSYGGSGSTLIACEKLDRRCFMMEIDTSYCDVIIKRWEDYTNLKAVKL